MRWCRTCCVHRMADCTSAACRADEPDSKHRRYHDCTKHEPEADDE